GAGLPRGGAGKLHAAIVQAVVLQGAVDDAGPDRMARVGTVRRKERQVVVGGPVGAQGPVGLSQGRRAGVGPVKLSETMRVLPLSAAERIVTTVTLDAPSVAPPVGADSVRLKVRSSCTPLLMIGKVIFLLVSPSLKVRSPDTAP